MEKFASYGFNRSHAAAYAIISYQTAYLKANYRREFYIAFMNLDIDNTDKISIFVQDVKRSGIEILPPDINKSEEYFIGENENDIRYSLGSLKGCGVSVMKNITDERKKHGPFKDVFDFFRRTKDLGLTKRQAESLVTSGALDLIHNNRRQILESIDRLLISTLNKDESTKQMSLFAGYKVDDIELENVQEYNIIEKLELERKAIGFYLKTHPMDIYSKFIEKYDITRSKDFDKAWDNLMVAGILLAKKEKLSKSGQKYAFLTISDQDNSFEVTALPDVYTKAYEYLTIGSPLLIDSQIKVESENFKLLANHIQNIDTIVSSQKVYIYIDDNSDIDSLYQKIETLEDGNNKISFIITKENGKKIEIETEYKKNLNVENRKDIEEIQGASLK
jgi:DNA polymerase-3 subunit alpha